MKTIKSYVILKKEINRSFLKGIQAMDIATMLSAPPSPCPACGKIHYAGIDDVCIEAGARNRTAEYVKKYNGTRAFLLADKNTWEAAGKDVKEHLLANGIEVSPYILSSMRAEPDEHAIGAVAAHMDRTCDIVVAVGSGVINDLGKVIAWLCNLPYIIVGTAPSMDGYASGQSSIIRDGIKYSLNTKCPNVVIGDLDILCKAPMKMIWAGFGDLLAKYISICEWRISVLITGEYFCEEIAALVNTTLKNCVDNLDGIAKRDPNAIRNVMDGMILSGIAMNYATISRPASGMEHYISHIFDMQGVEFGTPIDLHGIQCGIATVESLRIYEKIASIQAPDREKALASAKSFNIETWNAFLREKLGKSAETLIELEKKEGKYDVAKHAERLEIILSRWNEILDIIRKLPSANEVESMLHRLGAPTKFEEIGFTTEAKRDAIRMSKDIRDKYVGTRLLWDLGLLDEFV